MTTNENDNEHMPEISEIQIVPVKPRDGLLAFVSFVIGDSYYAGDVALYSRLDGNSIRLVYPMRTLSNGAKVNVFHPIRKDVADEIERQVNEAYEDLMKKAEDERKKRQESHE